MILLQGMTPDLETHIPTGVTVWGANWSNEDGQIVHSPLTLDADAQEAVQRYEAQH